MGGAAEYAARVDREVTEAVREDRLWQMLQEAKAILAKPRMGRNLAEVIMEQTGAMDRVIRVHAELGQQLLVELHGHTYQDRLALALRERDQAFERANRAARESAAAHDRADDLQAELVKLRESCEMVYSDRNNLQIRLETVAQKLGVDWTPAGGPGDMAYAHITAAITHLIGKLQQDLAEAQRRLAVHSDD